MRTFTTTALLLFAATGSAHEPLASFVGVQDDGYFGKAVSFVGDVDGDGVADLLVGAYRDSGAPGVSDQGTVRLFSGGSFALIEAVYGLGQDRYGWALADAGDVDGDGRGDFLVGAPQTDLSNDPGGYAELRSGVDRTVVYRWWGDASKDNFGWDVDCAGDVDNDGILDVVAGGRSADPGGVSDAGVARVFSGQNGELIHDITAGVASAWTGWAVAGVGDVDQDGHDDLLIGMPGMDTCCLAKAGRAEVRSGMTGVTLYVHEGILTNDAFSTTVAGVGDVDADGVPDYAISGKRNEVTWTVNGAVRIYSGTNGALLHSWYGPALGDNFGEAVASAGDLNGDGHADVVIGSPAADSTWNVAGRVDVRSGADGTTLLYRYGIDTNDTMGTAVAGGKDVNQDGRPDVLAGAAQSLADPGYAEVLSGTCGEITSYGSGCAGAGGATPSLTIEGCATPLGSLRVDVKAGFGGAVAMLLVGSQATNAPVGAPDLGCILLVVPSPAAPLFPLAGFGPGQGEAEMEVVVPLGIVAATAHVQVAAGDPTVPQGFTLTNGVRIDFD